LREVFVYVEGPSDGKVLETLLERVICQAQAKGNSLHFYPMGGKGPLLNKGPLKALNILRNKPNSHVFLLPDLYPKNIFFEHQTFQQLKTGLDKQFAALLNKKKGDKRLLSQFHVFCMKYDLEVLLLASETALKKKLNTDTFSRSWKRPVEDQDHDLPPKRIVEQLFRDCGMKYIDTIDAPMILAEVDYRELMVACEQQFKPFIEQLLRILA
jgi:hypothetical protein